MMKIIDNFKCKDFKCKDEEQNVKISSSMCMSTEEVKSNEIFSKEHTNKLQSIEGLSSQNRIVASNKLNSFIQQKQSMNSYELNSNVDNAFFSHRNREDLTMNIFDSLINKKKKGIKKLRGDFLSLPDFDEKIFENCLLKEENQLSNKNCREKCSIIFDEVTDTELFLAQERPNNFLNYDKRFSEHKHAGTQIVRHGNKENKLVSLEKIDVVRKNSSDSMTASKPNKLYHIISNENSTIQLPKDCNILILNILN